MKKIVMLTTMAGPKGIRQADTVCDVSDEEAAELVECGAAKLYAAPATSISATRPLTADTAAIDAVLAAARAEADQILSGARAEAEKIVLAARAEAERLLPSNVETGKPAADAETVAPRIKKGAAS